MTTPIAQRVQQLVEEAERNRGELNWLAPTFLPMIPASISIS